MNVKNLQNAHYKICLNTFPTQCSVYIGIFPYRRTHVNSSFPFKKFLEYILPERRFCSEKNLVVEKSTAKPHSTFLFNVIQLTQLSMHMKEHEYNVSIRKWIGNPMESLIRAGDQNNHMYFSSPIISHILKRQWKAGVVPVRKTFTTGTLVTITGYQK